MRQTPGFAVLTFDADGVMMPPELCEWVGGAAVFRGSIVGAKPRIRVRAGNALAAA